jgi:hypothetical protein
MPVNVIINPNLFPSTEVNFLNFLISPKNLFFPWVMGSPAISNHVQRLEFPAFDLQVQYYNYTDFLFEAVVDFESGIPFMFVNGLLISTGDLGTAIANEKREKFVDIGFSNLNLLSAGIYKTRIAYSVSAVPPAIVQLGVTTVQPRVTLSLKLQSVALAVFASVQNPYLQISYPDLSGRIHFNFFVGGSIPASKSIFFFPGQAVIVNSTDAELVFNQIPISANYGEIEVGFIGIEQLPVGNYAYAFTVLSGITVREVSVFLQVLVPGPTLFNLNPEEIIMTVVSGSGVNTTEILNVECSGNWNIVSDVPNWLSVSQLSGTGNAVIVFSENDTSSLVAGTYFYPIIIDHLGTQKVVNLTFIYSIFFVAPFLPDQLYFSKDLDFINFQTSNPDTYIRLTIVAKVFDINTSVSADYSRLLDLPFYKGKADFHVGTVVEQLMNYVNSLSDYVPSFESNYSKAQLQPVQVSVSYQELVYAGLTADPDLIYSQGNLGVFKMLKGNKPYLTNSQLSLLTVAQQELIRITPNSVIGMSFTYPGTPHVLVKKNNAIIDDFLIQSFSTPENPKMVFSYYRFANDFKPGDVVELMISTASETRSSRYLVFHEGLQSAYFFFENDNGQIEPFEFTGRRRVNSEFKNTLSSKFKNLKGFETKIDSNEIESLLINTGQLSKTEHAIIRAIIRSLNVWVAMDNPTGPYFKVDSTTTKITQTDTAENEDDFNVEFTILPT